MHVRSLQFTGRTTYTVSLPKEWVLSLGLGRGSKLYVETMPDGSLRIYANPKKEKGALSKEISIDEGSDLGSLIRRMIAAYLAGFSTLTLSFDPERRDLATKVREILESSILGFSVLKESKSAFTFYSVIDEESINLKDAVFRLYEDVYYMMDDALMGIRERNLKVLKGVIDQDQLVDKLYLFVAKQLTSMLMNPFRAKDYGLETAAEAPHLFLAVKSMERIADHASRISKESMSLISEGKDLPKWVVKRIEGAIDLFDRSAKALLNPESDLASEAARVIDEAARARGSREIAEPRLQIILNSVDRILSYSLDIAEAVIDMQAIKEAAKNLKQ